MEQAGIAIKYHGNKIVIAGPERQRQNAIDGDPFQRAFVVARVGCAMPLVNEKNKAEPILAMLAKAGPGDGAAQDQMVSD